MDLNNRETWLDALNKIAQVAEGGKFGRWWYSPVKYTIGQLWAKGIYPLSKRVWETKTKLFFGDHFTVTLPAGLDLFLLGAKSHDSEIRLARFFIRHIRPGDVIFDVGAHLGYFTLLASHLSGFNGRIVSWEASPTMFNFLKKNTGLNTNIQLNNQAVAASQGVLPFYEFPMLYSEYNSMHTSQYEKKSWFARSKPKEVFIEATTLDAYTTEEACLPSFIKIDVEGAEEEVIKGGINLLQNQKPIVIMEYIKNNTPEMGKSAHEKAFDILIQKGFVVHCITEDGLAREMADEPSKGISLWSDNLVFIHPENPIQSCC